MINGSIHCSYMPHIVRSEWLFECNKFNVHYNHKPSIDKCARLSLYVIFCRNERKKLQIYSIYTYTHTLMIYRKINSQENGKRNGKEDKTFFLFFFFHFISFAVGLCFFIFLFRKHFIIYCHGVARTRYDRACQE